MEKQWSVETLAIQGGYRPEAAQPRVTPIVQSTTFKYDNADHMASLFDLDCFDLYVHSYRQPHLGGF